MDKTKTKAKPRKATKASKNKLRNSLQSLLGILGDSPDVNNLMDYVEALGDGATGPVIKDLNDSISTILSFVKEGGIWSEKKVQEMIEEARRGMQKFLSGPEMSLLKDHRLVEAESILTYFDKLTKGEVGVSHKSEAVVETPTVPKEPEESTTLSEEISEYLEEEEDDKVLESETPENITWGWVPEIGSVEYLEDNENTAPHITIPYFRHFLEHTRKVQDVCIIISSIITDDTLFQRVILPMLTTMSVQTDINKQYRSILISQLLQLASSHDLSKLGLHEISGNKLHLSGAEDLGEYSSSRTKHFNRNAHHPEHWPKGFTQMGSPHVLEMIANWVAKFTVSGVYTALDEAADKHKIPAQMKEDMARVIDTIYEMKYW